MQPRIKSMTAMLVAGLLLGLLPVAGRAGQAAGPCLVITSDTLLAGIAADLLPPQRYRVEALLPPGQCPGHYDLKLSDIEKVKKAKLIIGFKGLPLMDKVSLAGKDYLFVNEGGHNWMTPDAYIRGLDIMAVELARRFPADQVQIMQNRKTATDKVAYAAALQRQRIRRAGIDNRKVVASSMQKEPLEWMGLNVLATYGRPESISTREVVRLSRLGKQHGVIAVVDNLQSGPDAGKGIAEALGAVHVVLSNFPSEQGYTATLKANVDAVLAIAQAGRP